MNKAKEQAAFLAAVRARDGHRCTSCGMTAVRHKRRYGKLLCTHRHHRSDWKSLDSYRTLCRKCLSLVCAEEWRSETALMPTVPVTTPPSPEPPPLGPGPAATPDP